MGQRRVRATIMSIRKVGAAAACLVVFFLGCTGQRTQVASPPSSVATTAPVTTTIVQATTITTEPPKPSPTVPEPWVTATTTTAKVVLTSYVPRNELEAMLCNPKWQWDCEEAIAIATCESNMNPNAISKPNSDGTRDRGLMQINTVWKEAWPDEIWARILEPEVNIVMAHNAYVAGNNSWTYWSCKRVLG
jgi:hypothetical protein